MIDFKKMSIQNRILIFITFSILVTTFIVTSFTTQFGENLQEDIIIDFLSEKNTNIQFNIENTINEAYHLLETQSKSIQELSDNKNVTLESIYKQIKTLSHSEFDYFWLSSKQPEINKLNSSELKEQLLFEISESQQEPHFKILNLTNSEPSFVIFKNIYVKEKYHSTIIYKINLQNLFKSIQTSNKKLARYFTPETTLFEHTSGKLIPLNYSPTAKELESKNLTQYEIEKGVSVFQGPQVIAIAAATSSDEILENFKPKLSIISEFNRNQISQAFNPITSMVVGTSLIGIICLILILKIYLNSLFAPLTYIKSSFEHLAKGRFEKIDSSFEQNNEFGALVTGYNTMIDRLRKTLADLNQSGKFAALGEMAAGIGHEINNPLLIIRGFAALTPKYVQNNQTQKILENSKKIILAIDRIAKIVKSLRQYARDGSQDPMNQVSIEQICEDTFVFCYEKFKNNSVDLRFNNELFAEKIFCRPEQITQILLNLLNNAYDAIISTEGEHWIQLTISQTENTYEFAVTNSGEKIPDKIADKLFTPFFTTKEVGKGTGLGLSISKSLAEKHKGELRLDRNSPLTRFVLTLPKAPSH